MIEKKQIELKKDNSLSFIMGIIFGLIIIIWGFVAFKFLFAIACYIFLFCIGIFITFEFLFELSYASDGMDMAYALGAVDMTKDLWIFNIIKPVPTLLFLIFTLMIAVYFFSNLRSKNKIKNLSDLAKK